jgi:hypothetical protein
MFDTSGILKNTGVALEKQAFDMFGAAVNNQAGGMLGALFGGGTPGVTPDQAGDISAANAVKTAQTGVWDPTPYASAIGSFADNFDPKTKFLFKVRFNFHPEILAAAKQLGVDSDKLMRELNFIVKQIDLPKVEFEYEEVNMYNFRTKVLKCIKNRELNLTFYDDTGNRAMNFVNLYMMLLKPITRQVQSPAQHLENFGFAFTQDAFALNTSLRDVLPKNINHILSSIVVEQFYMKLGGTTLKDAIRLNRFTIVNPRLQSFDIGDHDHEAGGVASTIAAAFDFDALHIDTDKAGSQSNITNHPLGDIMHAIDEAPVSGRRSSITSPGGANNPFIDIIARQGQRLVSTSVGNALNKAFGNGLAGQALNSLTSNMSGVLGEAAKRTLSGGTLFNKPSIPFVTDSNVSSVETQNLASRYPASPPGTAPDENIGT